VLYITHANAQFVGQLESQPVAGGPPIVLGHDEWTLRAYADSRVVFTDSYLPQAKRGGRAVLRAADASSSDAPSVIASYAGADFALTAARDRVAFSFNDGSARAGLYLAPLP
jgi:hypothetical protein